MTGNQNGIGGDMVNHIAMYSQSANGNYQPHVDLQRTDMNDVQTLQLNPISPPIVNGLNQRSHPNHHHIQGHGSNGINHPITGSLGGPSNDNPVHRQYPMQPPPLRPLPNSPQQSSPLLLTQSHSNPIPPKTDANVPIQMRTKPKVEDSVKQKLTGRRMKKVSPKPLPNPKKEPVNPLPPNPVKNGKRKNGGKDNDARKRYENVINWYYDANEDMNEGL